MGWRNSPQSLLVRSRCGSSGDCPSYTLTVGTCGTRIIVGLVRFTPECASFIRNVVAPYLIWEQRNYFCGWSNCVRVFDSDIDLQLRRIRLFQMEEGDRG